MKKEPFVKLSIRLREGTYNRLSEASKRTNHSKALIVERAVIAELDRLEGKE